MQFLVFRLYGPIASWGEGAGAEHRPTALTPTRSALLGLLAAALGLDRNDDPAQQDLAKSLRIAVLVEGSGDPLTDFHTAQLRKTGKRPPTSRGDQLAAASHELTTVVSHRHYRSDPLYTVVAWADCESPRWSLGDLAAALRQPVFTLYLGRKSCPLGIPCSPEIIEGDTAVEAIARYQAPLRHRSEGLARLPSPHSRETQEHRAWLHWDGDSRRVGLTAHLGTERRDEPGSRSRRGFRSRWELSAPLQPSEETIADVSQPTDTSA